MQQLNFIGNLAREGNANTIMFPIIEEAKETILDCSQETMEVLCMFSTIYFAII